MSPVQHPIFFVSVVPIPLQPVFNAVLLAHSMCISGILRMIETGLPGQLSWGFMMGMCSGFAVKKTAKVAAFTVGLAFVGLQALSYTGHINVDYAKVTKSAITALDQNNDGKIDKEDYKIGYDKLMEVLTFNLPAGSGFGVGFISGVRMG
ncbi:unnamed protein product [Choristocarpus tenellus]